MEGGQLGGDEWTRHGSFVNKPTRGWLHSDSVVSTTGVSYTVRVSELSSLNNYIYHIEEYCIKHLSILTSIKREETEMRKGSFCRVPLFCSIW